MAYQRFLLLRVVLSAFLPLCAAGVVAAQPSKLLPAAPPDASPSSLIDGPPAVVGEPILVTPETIATPPSEPGDFEEMTRPSLDAELLIVDEQFRQGFRVAAARRFATLSQRFPGEPRLLTRRFVAQVASGEFRQAVIIFSLAEIFGHRITPERLPGQMLAGLGLQPDEVQRITEQVARQALAADIDAATLHAVAAWLSLAGQQKSSAYFRSQAENLQKSKRVILRPADNGAVVVGESIPLPPPVSQQTRKQRTDADDSILLQPPLEFDDP